MIAGGANRAAADTLSVAWEHGLVFQNRLAPHQRYSLHDSIVVAWQLDFQCSFLLRFVVYVLINRVPVMRCE